jgi:hypothetical protein
MGSSPLGFYGCEIPSPHFIPREKEAFRFSQESLGVTGKTVKVIQKKTCLVKKKRLPGVTLK